MIPTPCIRWRFWPTFRVARYLYARRSSLLTAGPIHRDCPGLPTSPISVAIPMALIGSPVIPIVAPILAAITQALVIARSNISPRTPITANPRSIRIVITVNPVMSRARIRRPRIGHRRRLIVAVRRANSNRNMCRGARRHSRQRGTRHRQPTKDSYSLIGHDPLPSAHYKRNRRATAKYLKQRMPRIILPEALNRHGAFGPTAHPRC